MALETGAFMQASSYSAEIVRRAMFAQYARTSANHPGIIFGGLIGSTDFQISQLGSPNMSVNVSTGEAIVPGNEGGAQGGYYVRGTSTSNLAISTANPSNPRVDTVCLTCGDAQYTLPSGGTSGSLTLQVVTGTPTSGATLSNLSGAAALPGSSLLLGYVLVPAGASSIVTADISNQAQVTLAGATRTLLSVLGPGNGDATTSSTTLTNTNKFGYTLNLPGLPLRIDLDCSAATAGSASTVIGVFMDGNVTLPLFYIVTSSTVLASCHGHTYTTPPAGSHSFGVSFGTTNAADQATFYDSGTTVARLTVALA